MRVTAARGAAIYAVVFLLIVPARTSAGRDSQEALIRKVVAQFCAWDLEGARLSSRNAHFKDAAGLLHGPGAWPEEPIHIVSSYRIGAVHAKGEHAKVAVQYQLLAELRGGLQSDGLTISQRRETAWIPVSRVDASWMIDAAELSPHVSAEAMRSHIEQIRRDDEEAGDHHRQELLETLTLELGKLGPGQAPVRDLKPAPNQN